MIAKNKPVPEWLTCSCCGKLFQGVYDGSSDAGFGTCPECVVWESDIFVSARIKVVRTHLSPKGLRRFDALSKLQKQHVIFNLCNKGVIF